MRLDTTVVLDLKIDSLDRIVVLQLGTSGQTTISRFFNDGRPDVSFGAVGSVDLAIGSADTYGAAIALDNSGNIYATGSVMDPDSLMFVAKVSSAGVLDSSFGTGGFEEVALDPTGMTQSGGEAILVDAAGNVLVTGSSEAPVGHVVDLVRLAPDGSLDSTFAHGVGFTQTDVLPTDIGDHGSIGTSIAEDSAGNIVVAGLAISSTSSMSMFAARYTGEGDFDMGFSSGTPKLLSVPSSVGARARDVAIDGRGNILISGLIEDSSYKTAAIVFRLAHDGTADSTFGSAGAAMISTSDQGQGGRMAFSHEGNILMASSSAIYMSAWVNKVLDYDPLVVMPPSGF